MIDFPNAQRRVLDIVREVAEEKSCRPYLVGGPVRDLLLGRPSIDVDLTLEEASSVFAKAVAKRIGGRVRSYPQFLTYKITAESYPEIDIATARKEKYRAPGALPVVEAGKLKDDLLRRDFSINALAMDLMDGSLHDPADGKRDLDARVVRVLHDRSFFDDPTRILRAIRLATRLGFTVESESSRLINEAIAAGVLGTISRERIWREIDLAMGEDTAPQVLLEFDERGIFEHLIGGRIDPEAGALLARVRQELTARPDLDRNVLYTGALLHNLDADPKQLEGSGLSQKRIRGVLQIARDLNRFEQALAGASSDRQRFRLFKSASPELRTLLGPARNDAVRFEEFQRFKLPLRGNDLEVPLGPHVAKALERTREAVFTGEIQPEQARTFAREMAMKYLSRQQSAEHK